jgi:hypothetical protein
VTILVAVGQNIKLLKQNVFLLEAVPQKKSEDTPGRGHRAEVAEAWGLRHEAICMGH